jgi:two-component system CheB/CheR fusion protein
MTARKAGTGKNKARAATVLRAPGHEKSSDDVNVQGSRPEAPYFPIVGIGASAGGLEAFEHFFKHMPPDSIAAFILVPHLDPDHASMMTELLQRFTQMPVTEATDQVQVEPNHVYVIPPNRDMSIFRGSLQLSDPGQPRGSRMPIDSFFRSLAEDQAERAIGIILSGTGSDGTLGLRSIRGAGGLVLVQDPADAKYDGMPRSAINSGLSDYVLAAEKMPGQLLAYLKTFCGKTAISAPIYAHSPNALQKIFMLLRSRTGHDFSLYKKNTIHRRIERRLNLHGIDDIANYLRYLEGHDEEIRYLFKELLINVTSFFREPEAFEILKREILPELLKNKPDNYTFRVWVPGCATGEEPYSIAMILREYLDETRRRVTVHIFATDIDEDSINDARSGFYPGNIAVDVGPDRLKRFFIKEETGYRIKKEIRELVVFAVQNIIKDAPFTRLDLLICRNLLIYLEPELQNRLIPLFNYSLTPGGCLFLGSSESIGAFNDLFATLDRKWKFYEAKPSLLPSQEVRTAGLPWARGLQGTATPDIPKKSMQLNMAKVLLSDFAPPSAIVNEKGDILYIHGHTGKYLEPPQGHPSMNLFEMAREGLKYELQTAVHNAAANKRDVIRQRLEVKSDEGLQTIDLIVKPLSDTQQGLLLVAFQDALPPGSQKQTGIKSVVPGKRGRRTQELERELLYTKENLQATIEEQQASYEELKSTNEELQSTNEELQSTNEELETSKEELQSVNEELVTVNSELQAKVGQLFEAENDMKNLLDSTNIGTIFLSNDLHIKRFTQSATKVINLIPSDVGRPLSDIVSRLSYKGLITDAKRVLDTLVYKETEMQANDEKTYLTRIMPYRTLDNVIDGVVITFTDLTVARQASEELLDLEAARVPVALLIVNQDLEVVETNRYFCGYFGILKENALGKTLTTLWGDDEHTRALDDMLRGLMAGDTRMVDHRIEHTFPQTGPKSLLVNALKMRRRENKSQLALLIIEEEKKKPRESGNLNRTR